MLDAVGQYRDRDGQIKAEPTKVLLIVHGPDARPRAAIQELRDLYRRLFQQESVLLIESPRARRLLTESDCDLRTLRP